MFQSKAVVTANTDIGNSIHIVELKVPEIAEIITPGQFVNIRTSDSFFPFLRRPFSVCDRRGNCISVMFNVFGEGTKLLAAKRPGDLVDILGPLGNGFDISFRESNLIIVAGGLGAAPFPYVTQMLGNKKITTYIGGRSAKDIISYQLQNIKIATDDGSAGFHGNVIQLLTEDLVNYTPGDTRVFTCGPNAMMRALKQALSGKGFLAEASIESAMACGFGICQGCPVEHTSSPDIYKLICKDGPVFNLEEISF